MRLFADSLPGEVRIGRFTTSGVTTEHRRGFYRHVQKLAMESINKSSAVSGGRRFRAPLPVFYWLLLAALFDRPGGLSYWLTAIVTWFVVVIPFI